MYRVIMYYIKNSTKPPIVFHRAYIEDERTDHVFDEFVVEFENRGYLVFLQPIVLNGKVYDFTYHKTLEQAQEFCRFLGYEINPHVPTEAAWSGRIFRVK